MIRPPGPLQRATHRRPPCGTAYALAMFAALGAAPAGALTITSYDVPGSTSTSIAGINDAGQFIGADTDADGGHQFINSAGTISIINVPDAGISVSAINAAGQVTGIYTTSANVLEGFIYSGGTLTGFTVPGSEITIASAINASGQIVGSYRLGGFHGFLNTAGAITTLDYPGSSATFLTGINAVGDIIGNFVGGDGTSHAFLDRAGVFSIAEPDGADVGDGPAAINDLGALVGTDQNARGYLDYAGSISPVDVPGSDATFPTNINNAGQIAGYYADGDTGQYHGFLYSGGVYTTIDPTGSTDTQVTGLNNLGQVVGTYGGSDGTTHGFLTGTQPVPEPPTALDLSLGLAALLLVRRRPRLSSTTAATFTKAP